MSEQIHNIKESASRDEDDFSDRLARLEARLDGDMKTRDKQIAVVSEEVDKSMQRHENVLSVVQQALEDIQRHKDRVEVHQFQFLFDA